MKDKQLIMTEVKNKLLNLYENKIVYCEKMVTFLIKVEDLRIEENGFRATAHKIRLIHDARPSKNGRITEMEIWKFGAAWEAMSLLPNDDCIYGYGSWRIWTDPELVRTVERLLEEENIQEAVALTSRIFQTNEC